MSPASVPTVKLNNGVNMPIIGLGTWQSKPGEVTEAVKNAIDCGYRHIDCAFIYGNEPEVGAAIKEKIQDGTVKREDLFITSKVWNTFHSKELVLEAIKKSLTNLGLDYLDLYLIHWPMGYKERSEVFPKDENGRFIISNIDYIETWSGMENLVAKSLVKSIGLSNHNSKQIARIIKEGKIRPSVVQVECHPYLNQAKLLDFCKSKGITFIGYSPLGAPKRPWAKPDDPLVLEDPTIKSVAEKYNKSPSHIAIRYQIQRGVICIPKSVTKSRIESNFQVFDFELKEEDMKKIDSLNANRRALLLEWLNFHPYYPFHEEF